MNLKQLLNNKYENREIEMDIRAYYGKDFDLKSYLENNIPSEYHDNIDDIKCSARAITEPRPRLIFSFDIIKDEKIVYSLEIKSQYEDFRAKINQLYDQLKALDSEINKAAGQARIATCSKDVEEHLYQIHYRLTDCKGHFSNIRSYFKK